MEKIKIVLNGQDKEIPKDSTIQNIVDELKPGKMFVVEKNLDIIQKDQYNLTLSEGDKVEVVTFFGGG